MRLQWWIVPTVVAIMLLASWGLARTIRFPTETVTLEGRVPASGVQLQTVELTVQNLKCWKTSNAFVRMLSQDEGVIEVRTFVRTNRALVTFDPARTSVERLTHRINRPLPHPQTGEMMRVFSVLEVKK